MLKTKIINAFFKKVFLSRPPKNALESRIVRVLQESKTTLGETEPIERQLEQILKPIANETNTWIVVYFHQSNYIVVTKDGSSPPDTIVFVKKKSPLHRPPQYWQEDEFQITCSQNDNVPAILKDYIEPCRPKTNVMISRSLRERMEKEKTLSKKSKSTFEKLRKKFGKKRS